MMRLMSDLVLPLLAVDIEHDVGRDEVVRFEREVAPLQMFKPLAHQELHGEVPNDQNE